MRASGKKRRAARNYGKAAGNSIVYADALTKNWGNSTAQPAVLPEFEPVALPAPEPAAISESVPAFQTSFGNVYVNDWTAQAPDFQKQIAEENALRSELLEEVLPQPVAVEATLNTSDETFELDAICDEVKKEEAEELEVTLGKMIS